MPRRGETNHPSSSSDLVRAELCAFVPSWFSAVPATGRRPVLLKKPVLLEKIVERRAHRIGPDLVALLVGVQSVGHDVGGEVAVLVEELGAEVEVLHVPAAVVELGD